MENLNDKLRQFKMNALTAQVLHAMRINRYSILIKIEKLLTVVVPLLYLILLYISKGTSWETIIGVISTILSILLIGVSVISMILGIEGKLDDHKLGLKGNKLICNEVDNFISNGKKEEELEWFFKYVAEVDAKDHEIFAAVKPKEKQYAYREALKEFSHSNPHITCPVCDASPWKFVAGDCQLCGNKSINK